MRLWRGAVLGRVNNKIIEMESKMEKTVKAIRSVFPEMKADAITADLRLGNIPGWDSMNSINLQIELEKEFAVDLSDTQLTEGLKLSDVLDILKNKGGVME